MPELVVGVGDRYAHASRLLRDAEGRAQRAGKGRLGIGESDLVLRPLGAGDAGFHLIQVERQGVGENGIGRAGLTPHALRPGVGLHQGDALGFPGAPGEVVDGFAVDGEEPAGRAVFRRHVGDGGAVREPEIVEARPVELDELPDHAALAQHLGHGQHQIGRGGTFAKPAGELEADDIGQQHRDRLTEHRRLGLDAADAPAEHGEAVDHCRVAVGADQGVRIGDSGAVGLDRPHDLRQIFQVDLMADAGARRHHSKVLERLLAPAEKSVALAVARHLQRDVLPKGLGRSEMIDHHRMVDHEIDRRERIDAASVAAEGGHGGAHCGEVHHRRHAGEVLHEHARRAVGDFACAAPLIQPARNRVDIVDADAAAVLEAQQVLQQDLEGEGQAGDIAEAGLGRRRQAVVVVRAPADAERAASIQRVLSQGDQRVAPSSGTARGARLLAACAHHR